MDGEETLMAHQAPQREGKMKPGDNSGGRILSFIERVERLEEEKKALADDIREIYAEAKGAGYDPKILREIVRKRRMDADDRAEQEALLEVYMRAIGMLADTPLGRAGAKALEGIPA